MDLGGADAGTGFPGGGLRLERNPDEAVVQIDVEMPVVGPYRVARMVGGIGLVDNAEHPAEAIDEEVVAAAAADVVEQGLADPLQDVVLSRLEGGLQAFRGMVHDSDRVGPLLAAGPFGVVAGKCHVSAWPRSEEHTSELQSLRHL